MAMVNFDFAKKERVDPRIKIQQSWEAIHGKNNWN